MKYCFVSRELAGLRGGGIGTYVAEAAKALSAAGHEVWLVTEGPVPSEIEGFARVVPVEANPGRAPFLFGDRHYEHAFAVHETLQRIGAERFDGIEFADYQAEGAIAIREQSLLGSYGETVLSVTLHTPAYDCFELGGQLHRTEDHDWHVFALEDQMILDAPFLNSPSLGLRDRVGERLGLDIESIAIQRYPMKLPAGDEPALPGGRTSAVAASLEELDFVYVGRIEPRKGIESLLAAFAQMPELRLRLIGGDTPFSPYGGSFREWVEKRAPDNVTFCGELPRDELLQVLQTRPVVVLPSRFENWPNACLEAMTMGCVVLGSYHGGMGEMIEDGVSGFSIDGRSPDDIVRVVREKLSAALPRLHEIGAAARERVLGLARPSAYVERVEQLTAERLAELRTAKPKQPRSLEGKVSIVIPFFRDRATIRSAVESAIAQDYPSIEILIVNDGSPLEDAEALLAEVATLSPAIRVLHKQNGGLSSARNHGIEHATGDFFLFLDADNLLRPNYASTAMQALHTRPDLSFIAPHVRFFRTETGDTVGIYNPMPIADDSVLVMNRFGDAGAFFRRSVFHEHGLRYDEHLLSLEDWALWIDCRRLGLLGCGLPRTLYDYRMRDDSLMHTDVWPNFRALIGLIIERHLLPGIPEAAQATMRQTLLGLNQTWGCAALEMDAVREERGNWPKRYVVVDKLFGLFRRLRFWDRR